MDSKSIFADEWRDCLRAHFFHVVRTRDEITLPTLWEVLKGAGIDEAEIEEWYKEAKQLADAEEQED
jgi:hypothetical protein